MQKKIIALAIASALTAPALAFAEATVFGQANLAINRVNDGRMFCHVPPLVEARRESA